MPTSSRTSRSTANRHHKSGKRAYVLKVVQQPAHARLCGSSERDRRPIDPPPIVQLLQLDERGEPFKPSQECPRLVLHASLWSEDGTRDMTVINSNVGSPASSSSSQSSSPSTGSHEGYYHMRVPSDPQRFDDSPTSPTDRAMKRRTMQASSNQLSHMSGSPFSSNMGSGTTARVLLGSLVSSTHKLTDLCNDVGIFFIFHDLSVRVESRFRLKFRLFDLDTLDTATGECEQVASIFSEPFTVYSAKRFPGMLESTSLSKFFARQGVKIPLRSETRSGRSNRSHA